MPDRKYRKPTDPRIDHDDTTERLYELEHFRDKAIKEAAHELAARLGFSEAQFWTHAMPEELRGILEKFDNGAAEIAAVSFLENRGYTVTKKED